MKHMEMNRDHWGSPGAVGGRGAMGSVLQKQKQAWDQVRFP